MNVIFFQVDGILNFPASEAKAPDGSVGISEARVKALKNKADDLQAKIVLYGKWANDWDFDDTKCTPNGVYLNKKLNRRGLHILDKVKTSEDIQPWLDRRSNVENYLIMQEGDLDD